MSRLSKLLKKIGWKRRSTGPAWKHESMEQRRSYALNDLDLKLAPYLDFGGGYFVEAGANDGVSQSNTLYFEKYLRWTGLLVEPIPQLAQWCRENRPDCSVENTALVPFGFQESHIEMRYCNLMSLVKGAMKSAEEEEAHIQRGCQVQNIKTREVQVPANTLTDVLDKHQVQRIDLLSLDVEGFELSVLQGLDLDKHRPNMMLIEARYRDEIDDYLKPIYEPVADLSHHDVLYRRAAA